MDVQNNVQTSSYGHKKPAPVVIKRYSNRKLYSLDNSCYVTLSDVAKLIRENQDIKVIDNITKADITAATLVQIIFEAERNAEYRAPISCLREIIKGANGSLSKYLSKLGSFPESHFDVPLDHSKEIHLDQPVASERPQASTTKAIIESIFKEPCDTDFLPKQNPEIELQSLPVSNVIDFSNKFHENRAKQ